jgi:superfamily II RNA helicase
MKRAISIRISDEVDYILKRTGINASEFFRNKIIEEYQSVKYLESRKEELLRGKEELKEIDKEIRNIKRKEIDEQKFIYESKDILRESPELLVTRTEVFNRLYKKCITPLEFEEKMKEL